MNFCPDCGAGLRQVLVEAKQSRLEADRLRALVEGELAAIEKLEV